MFEGSNVKTRLQSAIFHFSDSNFARTFSSFTPSSIATIVKVLVWMNRIREALIRYYFCEPGIMLRSRR